MSVQTEKMEPLLQRSMWTERIGGDHLSGSIKSIAEHRREEEALLFFSGLGLCQTTGGPGERRFLTEDVTPLSIIHSIYPLHTLVFGERMHVGF